MAGAGSGKYDRSKGVSPNWHYCTVSGALLHPNIVFSHIGGFPPPIFCFVSFRGARSDPDSGFHHFSSLFDNYNWSFLSQVEFFYPPKSSKHTYSGVVVPLNRRSIGYSV